MTRGEATQRLLTNEQISLDHIAKLYAQADQPEQRHRLLHIARHHALRQIRMETFNQKGRGAIGIRHDSFSADQFPNLNQPGVIVIKTFPGFPGHAHLQPGDLILAIDGQPFPADLTATKTANQFIRAVQAHPAGALVRFTVYRNDQQIPVQLHLAELTSLESMYRNAGRLQGPFLGMWDTLREKILHPPKQNPQAPPPLQEHETVPADKPLIQKQTPPGQEP